jgi:hypothetical protein
VREQARDQAFVHLLILSCSLLPWENLRLSDGANNQ